jgi:hypothetical protein
LIAALFCRGQRQLLGRLDLLLELRDFVLGYAGRSLVEQG